MVRSVTGLLPVGILWIAATGSVSYAGENLFKVLAEAGAPVTNVEAPGSALVSGRPGLLKMLQAAGVPARGFEESWNASGPPDADPRLVRLLVKTAEDPNILLENGEPALIRAVRQELEEGVELLIDKGANVNLRDSRGRTALWHAQQLRNEQIVKLLLDAGADS